MGRRLTRTRLAAAGKGIAMDGLDRWDLALLAAFVLAAVWKLVSLMRSRRDRLIAEVQQQIDRQHTAKKAKAKKEKAA
jgi:hypothetical protein